MAGPDLALRRKFRKNVEEKLELVAHNNRGVVVSWTVSKSYNRITVVCGEGQFSERVMVHLATSLSRLLGVGRGMGLVDSAVKSFTLECFVPSSEEPIFVRDYGVE